MPSRCFLKAASCLAAVLGAGPGVCWEAHAGVLGGLATGVNGVLGIGSFSLPFSAGVLGASAQLLTLVDNHKSHPHRCVSLRSCQPEPQVPVVCSCYD